MINSLRASFSSHLKLSSWEFCIDIEGNFMRFQTDSCGLRNCTFEPQHGKTNNMTCAPSEESDQPGHASSLIRVFAVCSIGHHGTNASSGWRSDWHAQADLSIALSTSVCWF